MQLSGVAHVRSLAPRCLFWGGAALFVAGFVRNGMWHAVSLGSSQLVILVVLAAVVGALAAWLGRVSMATTLLMLGLAALAYFAGVRPLLALVLVGLAALGVGGLLVPRARGARVAVALVIGLVVMCGVDGWLLPLRVHFRVVYVPFLLIVVALRWRSIAAMLWPVAGRWSQAVNRARAPAALALLAVFAASTWAWLPTTLYDDLAYHLALPSELARLGYYSMSVGSNVWAIAPWGADVLQGIARVVAGTDARGMVDALWFSLSCVLVWRVCRELKLPPALQWLAVALFATLPLTMSLLHSMQTEGPTTTVMLALALVIVQRPVPERRTLVVMGLLFGWLLALKASNLWFAGPLGLWWLWRTRGRLAWRWAPVALAAAVLVGGSSYVYAWVLAGNPVLPLFNNFFRSPWYPTTAFRDPRWYTGFDWNLVWNLVFHPGRYIEGGSMGPALLVVLAGSFFVALTRPRARALALVGAVALLLPLSQIQYLRYACPALALLIPALLCGVPMGAGGRLQAVGTHVALWGLALVSLVFAGSAGWQVKTGALGLRVASGSGAVVAHYAPVRVALEALDARYGRAARVLLLVPDAPFAAPLAGQAFVVNWYDQQLSAMATSARAMPGAQGWLALFDRSGVNVVLTRHAQIARGLQQAIGLRGGQQVPVGTDRVAAWYLPPSRHGRFDPMAEGGWHVAFATAGAPQGDTLGQARVRFDCPKGAAAGAYLRVRWWVASTAGAKAKRGQHVPCSPAGVATALIHFHAPAQVVQLQATVHVVADHAARWKPVDARAGLRHDLAAERDMAARLVRRLRGNADAPRQIMWFRP